MEKEKLKYVLIIIFFVFNQFKIGIKITAIIGTTIELPSKAYKNGDKKLLEEVELLNKLKVVLENEKPVRSYEANKDEKELIKSFFLITSKPVIYCANTEDSASSNNEYVERVREYGNKEGAETISLCAKLEEELSSLDGEELEMFKEELGIESSGLDKLVVAGYKLLGLISYLTAGEQEVRAWTIVNGTKAPGAAGKIHTDFERGFIRAEIVAFDDLLKCGTIAAAKEKGLYRSEGKEYVMQDGDMVYFRFNV